ncbi:MAG: bifunctional 4-hydroxy-3-methylbut-2-enyl diphosphate reductase/30S ribosomal protein S1, partial [Bacillota bacterium]|nr:bifunctional 4-hydroxy-3-methylbut-2-enyl diphosphate reductase/30S ribosomal protein S1 [Bacillota bacterium]
MIAIEITVANKAGFCFGVKKALDIAESAVVCPTEQIFTLGPLIHNPQVVTKLADKGIVSINDLTEITSGKVIIRSHGVAPEIINEAKDKGLELVDATCPFVNKAQQLAKEHADKGYLIVIVGDPTHPEVEGIFGWSGNNAKVIEDIDEVTALPQQSKICVVAQTTQSIEKFNQIVAALKGKADEVKVCNTICDATRQRQDAAKKLALDSDIMIVVGGRNSSNTRKLTSICEATGTPTYHIEQASELKQEWFVAKEKIGVTAGASTPDWILEEVINKMTEINNDVTTTEETNIPEASSFNRGDIISGTVVQINEKDVLVDVGGKSEGIIPLTELSLKEDVAPETQVKVGDVIQLYVIKPENEEGNPILSKRRADRITAWEKISQAFENGEVLEGIVEQVVKGGLLIDVGFRGFMPASLVEIGYVENLEAYVGQTLSFKVIEIEKEKNKIVLSRKAVLEKEQAFAKEKTLEALAVGQTVTGTVRRLTNFGAFIDIGGVDGLLHVSELSWGRVNHPKEVLSEGQELQVYVLAVDKEKGKISLGLKQLAANPWQEAAKKYKSGDEV